MGVIIPDSPEIIQAKRRIMLNQPHLETKSGTSVTIKNAVPKIDSIRLFFGPTCAGSGTPSVDNKRTLGGVYWPPVYINGVWNRVSPTNTQGTYGAIYDTKTGIMTKILSIQTATGGSEITSYSKRTDGNSIFWVYCSYLKIYDSPVQPLSNMFTFAGNELSYAALPVWSFVSHSGYHNSCYVKVPTSVLPEESLDGAKQWVSENNIQIVAPYRWTSAPVDLGTKDFSPGRGTVTITVAEDKMSDPYFIDTLEVSYWTH